MPGGSKGEAWVGRWLMQLAEVLGGTDGGWQLQETWEWKKLGRHWVAFLGQQRRFFLKAVGLRGLANVQIDLGLLW